MHLFLKWGDTGDSQTSKICIQGRVSPAERSPRLGGLISLCCYGMILFMVRIDESVVFWSDMEESFDHYIAVILRCDAVG